MSDLQRTFPDSLSPAEQSVDAQLLHAAYNRTPVNLLLTVAATVIIGTQLWHLFPSMLMMVWVGAILLSITVSYVEWVAFRRATPAPNALMRWQRLLMIQAVTSGAALAFGPMLMMPRATGAEVVLLVGILLCVCAVVMITVAEHRTAMQGFIIAALMPPAIVAWRTGGDIGHMVALVLISATVLLLFFGRRFNRSIRTLLENRFQMHAILNTAMDAIIEINAQGRITEWNFRAETVFGWTRDEALGLALDDNIIPEQYRESHRRGLAWFLSTGERRIMNRRIETTVRHRNGKEFPVELAITPHKVGDTWHFTAFITDITGRKRIEERLQRITQLHAALSQCNQAIVRCASEEELFPQICHHAVQFGGMKMVWIGLVDQAGQQVKPVAAYGEGIEYLDGIQISVSANDANGIGPAGTAIRENQPVWTQDFIRDPCTAAWHERASHFGWAASASLPLLKDGTPVGCLMLYAGTANAFDEDARKLLVEMAIDISFALDNFTREATRKATEEALRASEVFNLATLNSVAAEIAVLDRDGVILAVNEPWQRFALENGLESGKPVPHTAVGANYLASRQAGISLIPDDVLKANEGIQSVLDGKLLSFHHEYACHSPAKKRWFSMSVTPLGVDRRGVVISHDNITKSKQAEEKLQLAASVFTHAREGIMITDPDGTIIDVNEAFSRITGYDHDEALGQNPRILNSGRQGKKFYTALFRDLIKKNHWYGEVWNRRKNGKMYAAMQTISTVRDAQDNIQHYVAIFSDITALKEHALQLEHIAHYDALTNLPNRVLLADRLRQAMTQAQRRGQRLAVVFLDLDGFKAINDSHGHAIGDQLLTTLASRMKQDLREGDTLARIGGDEFVAVLLDLENVAASVPMLSRLLAAAAQPVTVGDLVLQVSASLGVTFYPQAEDLDADQLLRQADQAMYQAKQTGKNRYHVFDAEQDSSVRGLHESLDRIRRALAAREFVLYYQPKVNMRTGTVIGAEALIRWQHPERGLLPPFVFLPVVENHPLAIEIGEWVIDSALTQMELWHAAGLDIPISVNIGARQLQQADFAERLRDRIAAHPEIMPCCLELEILETSALEDIAQVSQVMEDCRQIGVSFALDDFGTGYSSLTYLKRLPVSLLKIDQSFVRDMLDDPDDLAILEGVLGLATAFRREVIAEGVETIEHGEMLLQLGCELAQGYGIARPMPAHEMPGWSVTWQPDSSWVNATAVSRPDLPLLHAMVEHRAWITAMKDHLNGERQSPPPLDHHQCRFGQWLDAEGLVRYATQPAFQAIEPLHLQVHALAAELLALHAGGQSGVALARLDELHALRDALLKQLKALVLAMR